MMTRVLVRSNGIRLRPGIKLIAIILIALMFSAASTTLAGTRCNFNPDWRLFVGDPEGAAAPSFDDASWKPVTLPRSWNEDQAFARDINKLTAGVAWYRKRFTLPAEATGKKVFLEFEGVRQAAEVFVNGKSAGLSENGVMAFGLDITELLHAPGQENIIAVRTDSSWKYLERATQTPFQWNDLKFYANYGGINKNVALHVADKLHQTLPLYSNLGTTGVYIYATDIDIANAAATVHVESQVKNDHMEARTFTYEVTVTDLDGKPVKSFAAEKSVTLRPGEMKTVTTSARLTGLQFWSWGYGYLYTVTTTLKVDGKPIDAVSTRTGFRKTRFDHGYLTLNDRPIQIHGYAERTTNEWPAVGSAVPAWISDFSNALMVESGGNLVRWMHVTPWKQDVESCDRLGLMQSLPAGDEEKDVEGRMWQQRVELMRDAIIYNRNNPSVIFYECGNNTISEEHMAEMKKLRDQFDPQGGRAIGSRGMHGSKVADFGGDMFRVNKSAGKPMWAMEYCRDENLRKYWDEFSPPYHKDGDGPRYGNATNSRPYHRNQDSFAIEGVVRWYEYWKERPGTGTRVNAGGVKIMLTDSNTHFRGTENYRRSGEVDAVRLPKDSFFAHQVIWDGWVDVERPRVHIIGHWNYANDVKKDITVVASTPTVKLSLNGRDLGTPEQSSNFLFTFKDVQYEPGTLKAIGCDASGKELCAMQIKTAGAPAALRLTPIVSKAGFRADGADLALVDVEVVDAAGQRCPTALNPVKFTLTGPAEWRGGIAQEPGRSDNFILATELHVECGVNRVLIRSTTKPGTMNLRAESEGLVPATISLTSTPVVVTNGITASFASDGLSSRLDRGPTPRTPSFTITREPLQIRTATAGSHPDSVSASFDDDETTRWSSDAKRGSNWIEYELTAPAMISEVVLKLDVGWRTSCYFLKITVDGQTAFTGTTPTTLGYVTLPLKPTLGKVVRIEVIDETKDATKLDLTEVTGKKSIEATPASAKLRLEIYEAEIYGPVSRSK